MIYHTAHQRVEAISRNGGVSSFDGTAWTVRHPAIQGLSVTAACYDRHSSRVVLMGTVVGSGSQNFVFYLDPNYNVTATSTPGGPAAVDNLVYHEARRACISATSGFNPRTWSFDTATNTWTDVSGSTVRPTPRNDAMLAVDDSRGAILFGGHGANLVPNNETWLWDSATWTQLGSTVRPSARYSAAMADGRDSVVLFGGINAAGQPLNDTWVFTASGWQQLNTLGSVPARRSHAMAANSADAAYSVYMFGGTDGQNWFGDLHKLAWNYFPMIGWRWIWHTIPTVGGPGGRDDHAMVVDVRRQKLVLFGGRNEFWQQFNDTWEFDLGANTWTQRSPSQSPAPRMNPGMAYDRQRERVVLVGGYDLNTGASFDDIWEWDGTDWTQRIPHSATIAPTANTAMAYDHRTQRVVMFGGWNGGPNDNTYELIEHTGPAAPSQNAPLSLTITSAPAVLGNNTTPLVVEVPSSGNLSALFVGLGPAPHPHALGSTPLFCSSGQTLFVPDIVTYWAFGNPASYSVSLPPIAAGALLSFQAMALTANGCMDATNASFATVRRLQ